MDTTSYNGAAKGERVRRREARLVFAIAVIATIGMLTMVEAIQGAADNASQRAKLAALLQQAIASRVGAGASVTVKILDEVTPEGQFASASPDPLGRLGREMNFTLASSAPGGRTVRVRAQVDVVMPHVEARRAVLRGHVVEQDDVVTLTSAVTGVPVKRLPELQQIVGQSALRPITAGQVIESSAVALRRMVKAGDTVTVIAIVGTVRVTAEFVAADSGDPGDIVRVVNRDTRRSIRARVVEAGVVEVINER